LLTFKTVYINMMFTHKTVLGLVAAAALAHSTSGAGITLNTGVTADQLVTELIGDGVKFRNAVLTTASGASAIFTDDSSKAIFGFSNGVALSTGAVQSIVGTVTNEPLGSVMNGLAGDVDLNNEFFTGRSVTNDATILEFEFECENPTGFSFEYVFGSEEYNFFVGAGAPTNDVFAFFLNGKNIALLPDGNPVSINTINCGSTKSSGGNFDIKRTDNFCQELFVENTGLGPSRVNSNLNGFTKPIFTNQPKPVGFNKLKIVIADTADSNLDSVVLLAKKSLVCKPPPDKDGGGGGQGDPHFMTWRGQHYDYHGECDLLLLQSQLFAGLGLDVHIRTKLRRDMSYISGAALRIGSDVLEVEGNGVYYLNGVANAELPSEFGGFAFFYTQPTDKMHTQAMDKMHVFEIYLGGRERIKVKTYKDYVSVLIEQGQRKHFTDSVGLMGDFHYGVKLSRDGKRVINDANEFGQEWQVLDTDPTLFQSARFPQHPQKCTMPTPKATKMLRRRLSSESAADQLAAEEACAHWGEYKDDCIFDVLATGDVGMAQAGAY
jgi:hypothetical protein